MSIMVGTGKGAQNGILIKNAEALEGLEKVDTIVVDKTGTLTEGHPELVMTTPFGEFDEETLLTLAASVETASEHPLAAAIVRGAKERSLSTENQSGFQSVTGQGAIAEVSGKQIAVGNEKLMRGVDAFDDKLGLLGVADPIKKTTVEAIAQLHAAGLKVVMLTGDNAATAEAVAREIGIDEVHAGVSPEDKSRVVRELQEAGSIVAMAGDGINDAPALAQADIGIAMGTGTDVAIESAGVTLVRGDLLGVAKARNLSRATMKNIRQNLFLRRASRSRLASSTRSSVCC
jgi:Cu+-exporting ATPase